jgi:hypothetical protein
MDRPLRWIVPLVTATVAILVGIGTRWTATVWVEGVFGIIGCNLLFLGAEEYLDLRRFLRFARYTFAWRIERSAG